MASRDIIKLGFGAKQDLAVVRASWPALRGLDAVAALVEVWREACETHAFVRRRRPAEDGGGVPPRRCPSQRFGSSSPKKEAERWMSVA